MKKLIFILSIAAIGCSKLEPKACYKCTIVTSSTNYSSTDYFEICDWTASDARDYEESGTGTSSIGGTVITQKTECHIR